MTSRHNTDIHTNTVRTNFNHFSTLPQNLVLLWWILFEKYFFKHSNPISSVVSEIKSGVRGSYAAEKVGTLKVNMEKCYRNKIVITIIITNSTHHSKVLAGLIICTPHSTTITLHATGSCTRASYLYATPLHNNLTSQKSIAKLVIWTPHSTTITVHTTGLSSRASHLYATLYYNNSDRIVRLALSMPYYTTTMYYYMTIPKLPYSLYDRKTKNYHFRNV